MQKAEKILSFKQKAPEIIKSKVMAYENPLDEMIIYATQKSKYFSKDSDIILLVLTHQYGYGRWRDIKRAIRRDARFRFDHLFLSRNEQELQRRVDILVKALEKEDQVHKKKLETQGNLGGDGLGEDDMMMDDGNYGNDSDEEVKRSESNMVNTMIPSTLKRHQITSATSSEDEEKDLNH